jgi:hypothetical protein
MEARFSVLVGPTCPACESDDLRWRTPLGGVLLGECQDCATEYRGYEVPLADGKAPSGKGHEASCRFCGVRYLVDDNNNDNDDNYDNHNRNHNHNDNLLCLDCELSDCAYCGVTTNRPLLSDNLACQLCDGVAA